MSGIEQVISKLVDNIKVRFDSDEEVMKQVLMLIQDHRNAIIEMQKQIKELQESTVDRIVLEDKRGP